jgi:predicted transcriptional regulator
VSTQVQIPEEMSQRFEELARYAGQSREQVILEVLEDYLRQIAEEDARIDEALAQVEHGEVIDADEAFAEAEAMLLARGITREHHTRSITICSNRCRISCR